MVVIISTKWIPVNKLLFACVFTLCVTNCFGQFTNDYHTKSILKGKVDSVVSKTYFFYQNNSKQDDKNIITKETDIYDKNKRLKLNYHSIYLSMPHTGIDARPVKTIYTYNSDGNLIENLRFFTTGQPWVKNTFLKKGLLIENREYFCPDSSISHIDTLKINVNGNVIECDDYFKDGKPYTKSYYKYSPNGKLIEEITRRDDGSLMFRRTCKYNNAGDMIEDNNPYGDRDAHTYTYQKYDTMKNWLVQIEYINGRPIRYISRNIYYHK